MFVAKKKKNMALWPARAGLQIRGCERGAGRGAGAPRAGPRPFLRCFPATPGARQRRGAQALVGHDGVAAGDGEAPRRAAALPRNTRRVVAAAARGLRGWRVDVPPPPCRSQRCRGTVARCGRGADGSTREAGAWREAACWEGGGGGADRGNGEAALGKPRASRVDAGAPARRGGNSRGGRGGTASVLSADLVHSGDSSGPEPLPSTQAHTYLNPPPSLHTPNLSPLTRRAITACPPVQRAAGPRGRCGLCRRRGPRRFCQFSAAGGAAWGGAVWVGRVRGRGVGISGGVRGAAARGGAGLRQYRGER